MSSTISGLSYAQVLEGKAGRLHILQEQAEAAKIAAAAAKKAAAAEKAAEKATKTDETVLYDAKVAAYEERSASFLSGEYMEEGIDKVETPKERSERFNDIRSANKFFKNADPESFKSFLENFILNPEIYEMLRELISESDKPLSGLTEREKKLIIENIAKMRSLVNECEKMSTPLKAFLSTMDFGSVDGTFDKKVFIDTMLRKIASESISQKSTSKFFDSLLFIQDKVEKLMNEIVELTQKNAQRESYKKKAEARAGAEAGAEKSGAEKSGKSKTVEKSLTLEALVKTMSAQVKSSSNSNIDSIEFRKKLLVLLKNTFTDINDLTFADIEVFIVMLLKSCKKHKKMFQYIVTNATDGAKFIFANKTITFKQLLEFSLKTSDAFCAQFERGSILNKEENIIKYIDFNEIAEQPMPSPVIKNFVFCPDADVDASGSCKKEGSHAPAQDSSCCGDSGEKKHGLGKYCVTVEIGETSFCVNIDCRSMFLNNDAIEQIAKCGAIHSLHKHANVVNVSISMQTDAHCVSKEPRSPWIGLVMVIDGVSIPFELIAADIGCGMTLLPICKTDGKNLNVTDFTPTELEKFKGLFLLAFRSTVFRGKGQESGDFKPDMTKLMTFLQKFFDGDLNQIPLTEYVVKFYNMFLKLANGDEKVVEGILSKYTDKDIYPNITYTSSKNDTIIFEDKYSKLMYYLFGFSCSLGKDGNHFAEMVCDENGNIFIVTHSGSRGLGGQLFQLFSKVSTATSGGSTVLSDEFLVSAYAETHELLRQFACYNRAIVTLNLITAMSQTMSLFELSTDASVMIKAMLNHELFLGISAKDISQLITGKAHNTFSCYLNKKTKKKGLFVSKGAITYALHLGLFFSTFSPGKNAGIVGFSRNDENQAISCSFEDFQMSKYDIVTSLEDAEKMGVSFGPHGAGRQRSATDTASNITYDDINQFASFNNMWYNQGTSTPGDGSCIDPKKNAYNNVDAQKLKVKFIEGGGNAMIYTTLSTAKECTDFNGKNISKFMKYILEFANSKWVAIAIILQTKESFEELSPDEYSLIKSLIQIDLVLARSMFSQNSDTFEDIVLYKIICALYNTAVSKYWNSSLAVKSFNVDNCDGVVVEDEEHNE